jgi:hypothetical protein
MMHTTKPAIAGSFNDKKRGSLSAVSSYSVRTPHTAASWFIHPSGFPPSVSRALPPGVLSYVSGMKSLSDR